MANIKEKQMTLKNGDCITIRTALPEDAKTILNYTKKLLVETPYMLTTSSECNLSLKQEREFLQEYLLSKGRLAIVAELNHEIIGFLNFQNGRKLRNQHTGEFGMSVSTAYHNQGVGRSLLTALLDWARSNPLIEKVCLEVFSTNKSAIALYKKVGFIEEGRKLKAIKLDTNSYDDLVLMAKFTK